jgi:hypothetical protein
MPDSSLLVPLSLRKMPSRLPRSVPLLGRPNLRLPNGGRLPHPIRLVHRNNPKFKAPWNQMSPSGVIPFRVTFRKPGIYPFICSLHDVLGMKGSVVVLP